MFRWIDGQLAQMGHKVSDMILKVVDIKRLNNMMSDHGIYSRERLLIPISHPNLLTNGTCYIELDTYAKREVAVLYVEGEPDRRLHRMSNGMTSGQGRKRVIDSLKRSIQVDDGTAQYFCPISNGDPRAAITEFSEDLRWERQAGWAQMGIKLVKETLVGSNSLCFSLSS